MFHLRFFWNAMETYWWDFVATYFWEVFTTFIYDIVETYHWDVLVAFQENFIGCFIWDVPEVLMGHKERRLPVFAGRVILFVVYNLVYFLHSDNRYSLCCSPTWLFYLYVYVYGNYARTKYYGNNWLKLGSNSQQLVSITRRERLINND